MKYGLVVYEDTDNIGDDILSYAASRFLPTIDYIIDRENLDTFVPDKAEQVCVIVNGWFLYNKFNWPPSEYIRPLFIGTHFSGNDYWGIKDEYLDGYGKEYLKKYQPIGCRDYGTLEKLENRGIESYFSGCLTLTIHPFENVLKGTKIILVDVPENVNLYLMQKYKNEDIEIISHDTNCRNQNWEQRSDAVETLLKKYQSAKLIITTRLHCALPASSLGTPVLLIKRDNDDYRDRIGSFETFLNTCTVEQILNGEIELTTEYRVDERLHLLGDKLKEKCKEFVDEVKEMNVDILPDVEEFKSALSEKIRWQKELVRRDSQIDVDQLYKGNQWLEQQVAQKDKYIDELIAGKSWLEQQIENKDNYIQDLVAGKNWLEEQNNEKEAYIKDLYQGNEWLHQQNLEQQKYINELESGIKWLKENGN